MATKKQYEELKEKIHFHNYRYHVLDAPVISDAEFDRLLIGFAFGRAANQFTRRQN